MGDVEPPVRVVRGAPTAEELAALMSALLAGAGSAATAGTAPMVSARSEWVRNTRPGVTAAGLPTDRGPHVWRLSALPR